MTFGRFICGISKEVRTLIPPIETGTLPAPDHCAIIPGC